MAKFKKSTFPMAEVGGALAGAVATGLVKKLLDKSAPDLSPTIKGAVITAGGAFLAMQKSPMLKGAGLAMVSVGGYDLVSAFLPGGISGIEDIFINAPADQSILSAPADQSILSSPEYYINGEEMNGEDFSINGEEMIGEDYQINGEDEF
jgi:hypothetical protein